MWHGAFGWGDREDPPVPGFVSVLFNRLQVWDLTLTVLVPAVPAVGDSDGHVEGGTTQLLTLSKKSCSVRDQGSGS